jgi:serine/threonine-protein kinase
MSESLDEHVVRAVANQYEIECEIGRGGMAVVYRARDIRLNRTVALKVLPPELAYDPAIRMRFTREAQTSAQLSHAHIVPIYDVGEREGIAYFVMGLVTGGNLASLLAREPRQPISEVRRLASEVADALAYAHLRGVIHRDIKPDNILLDGLSGRAMVTDFGIARAVEAGPRLTLTGVAVGTPAYMSPEQAVGDREVDGRSDIYSLGIVAYQMLTGRVPFAGTNSVALLLKHVGEPPRPITELRPETPRPLREAIERALSKDAEDRWPTADALRDALIAERASISPWRSERREPVKYTSPNPDRAYGARSPREGATAARPFAARGASGVMDAAANRPASDLAYGSISLVPEHLARLTEAERADLRLWHGRVNLLDRIKAMRGYTLATLGAVGLGIAGFAFGVSEAPPLVLAPIVPIYMSVKLWRRGGSLREAGLKLRRVLLMPRARWVLPSPAQSAGQRELARLASRELLDSPHGDVIRRAVEDRAAIVEILASLSKADRALLPDLEVTVNGLVERVVDLAEMLKRLEQGFEPRLIDELDERVGAAEREGKSPEGERRLTLLRKQRDMLEQLAERRLAIARQLESAGLALGNLRLDMVRVRSSGLRSSLSDVSSATQEARALSRDIGALLEAAEEVRSL